MNRLFCDFALRCLGLITIAWVWWVLLMGGTAWALPYALDEYRGAAFKQGIAGRGPECVHLLANQTISSEPAAMRQFSVFAFNSIWLRPGASILSGDIGTRSKSSGPWLKSKVEIFIDKNARVKSGIYGDSVSIGKKATVFDVHYNELKNKGKILGKKITPVALPVWEPPPFMESKPGWRDIKVKKRTERTLSPGAYDTVRIKEKGRLRLSGGTYHFSTLELDNDTSLICMGPATILIRERLLCNGQTRIAPSSKAGISAKDLVIYIGSFGGTSQKSKHRSKDDEKDGDDRIAVVGDRSRLKANVYAPHGTLWIGESARVEGSLIAKDIIIDVKARVKYNGCF
jgi:hypothetical protein